MAEKFNKIYQKLLAFNGGRCYILSSTKILKGIKMTHAEQTIVDLEKKREEVKAELLRIETAINCLCEVMGQPRRYEETTAEKHLATQTRADQYYGRPLATVAAEVLEKRKEAGIGAATLDQLFTELSRGGFKFEGKNEGIQKRGLAIAMGKNTAKFHKLPNDTWGLMEWYPKAKEGKEKETIVKEIIEGAEPIKNSGEGR